MSYIKDYIQARCADSPEFRAAYEAELADERLEKLRTLLGKEEDSENGRALVRLDAAAREKGYEIALLPRVRGHQPA